MRKMLEELQKRNLSLEVELINEKIEVGYLYSYDGLGLVLSKSRKLDYKEVRVILWDSIVMIKPKKSNIPILEESN